MKRLLLIAIFSVVILTGFAATKIEVYYFHYTRRCVTCQAVETESQKIISALYAKELKEGKIKFTSVNLDEKNNNTLADKCKAEGQALLVISGKNRIDLTDEGFMYATSKQEKLKAAFKKAIDPLL